MAFDDFWINVRSAARLPIPQSIVDSAPLDPETIERALRSTTTWLTPGAVAGFDEGDFSFLTETERTHFTRLVRDFSAKISNLSPAAPTPRDVVERSLPLFREIVESLEFNRYGDPEAFRLGKMIEKKIASHRPPELADLRFNTGSDHSGDPALWIWVFLSAEVSGNDEEFLNAASNLREQLDPVARRVAPDRWPYISFRSLVEQSEPVEAS
jgi:hypothetical protein